jgi:putative transposase
MEEVMARFARVVVPGCPYHVTCRGNRREAVFFTDEERQVFVDLFGEYSNKYGLHTWGWCLMTNHVHLLVVGDQTDSLSDALGRCAMRYARWVNRWHGWSGHLWGDRFHSTPLDEGHVWTAIRYIEQNPVRAGLVNTCEAHSWSSTLGNAGLREDRLLCRSRPFPGSESDWLSWVNWRLGVDEVEELRRNTRTGRPTGSRDFVADLERRLDRVLEREKVGRKRRTVDDCTADLFARDDQ